jgi:hypothetical protein
MYMHYTLSRDLSGNQDNVMSNLLSPLAEKEKKRGAGLQALAARDSEAGGFSRRFLERNGGDKLIRDQEASQNAESGPFSLDPDESTDIGVDSETYTYTPGRRGGLDDLAGSLPFNSAARPPTPGSSKKPGLTNLNLPQPPRSPSAPRGVDAESFGRYIASMKSYMTNWYKFESVMIEHFRQRQMRLQSDMDENWLSMFSDGPSSENVDATGSGGKGGYAAYMQWRREDDACHVWWDKACGDHSTVMAELGKIREEVKGIVSVRGD